MDAPASGLLTDLLKQVSRSFYLTMRVLPAAIRPQISVAYLLARATDTVADTQIVPLAERLQALQALREGILGGSTVPLNFGELARHQSSPAEWRLLQRIEEPLALHRRAGVGPESVRRRFERTNRIVEHRRRA